MLLIPDLSTANMDPFREEPTLILSCDVVEPSDLKGYDRDPRSLAKRAEAYLKSSGLGDTAYFGPEPEFFVFDGVTWNTDMSGTFVKIKSEEASWSTGLDFEGGNTGHRPRSGRLLPRAPGRFVPGHAFGNVPADGTDGRAGRSAPPRSGGRRPAGNRHQVQHAGAARRLDADHQVHHS